MTLLTIILKINGVPASVQCEASQGLLVYYILPASNINNETFQQLFEPPPCDIRIHRGFVFLNEFKMQLVIYMQMWLLSLNL